MYRWARCAGADFRKPRGHGTRYNTHNSLLLSRIGWFTTQKIGKSDDRVNYRRKFAKDAPLHEYLAKQLEIDSTPRDSWPRPSRTRMFTFSAPWTTT